MGGGAWRPGRQEQALLLRRRPRVAARTGAHAGLHPRQLHVRGPRAEVPAEGHVDAVKVAHLQGELLRRRLFEDQRQHRLGHGHREPLRQRVAGVAGRRLVQHGAQLAPARRRALLEALADVSGVGLPRRHARRRHADLGPLAVGRALQFPPGLRRVSRLGRRAQQPGPRREPVAVAALHAHRAARDHGRRGRVPGNPPDQRLPVGQQLPGPRHAIDHRGRRGLPGVPG